MKLTVVISYYKALDNLKLILMALEAQSERAFLVIVSEDDINPETIEFIAQNHGKYSFQLLHVHQQEDLGFRKNMMLNKCLRLCTTPMMAFVDGDCIPHRHFVKQYIARLQEGGYLTGRSVMMGPKFSAALKKSMSLERLHFWSILFSDCTEVKHGFYFPLFALSYKARSIYGRNWGILTQYLHDVNGYDEDYVTAGVGEDVDIEWRLKALGLKRKSMKNLAIVYHIYHDRRYTDEIVAKNMALKDAKREANHIRCLNGLEKLA